MVKPIILLLAGMLSVIVILQSCTSDKAFSPDDASLFAEVYKSGYTYYQNDLSILPAGGDSPHGFVRIKFNEIAQASLDSTGKLPLGASFPEGAVIVKEIYADPAEPLIYYVIMKKDPAAEYAADGWLWGEYEENGTVSGAVSNKGSGCTGCHSESPNRDFVRTFDLH